jgi:hypothetical protein
MYIQLLLLTHVIFDVMRNDMGHKKDKAAFPSLWYLVCAGLAL